FYVILGHVFFLAGALPLVLISRRIYKGRKQFLKGPLMKQWLAQCYRTPRKFLRTVHNIGVCDWENKGEVGGMSLDFHDYQSSFLSSHLGLWEPAGRTENSLDTACRKVFDARAYQLVQGHNLN